MLWWRCLRPRLRPLLPTGTLLEIAPGFGRWTEYLLHDCHELIGVDATERCVDVCRQRFAGMPARFSLNDGRTLPMVADASLDAAFSFDSLVHVDAPEIMTYLHEIARCLKPVGRAFLHHSNLGAYAERSTGVIPSYVSRTGWRAASMSAHAFRRGCREAGLHCLTQEVITWRVRGNRPYRLNGNQLPLSDCFSMVARPEVPGALPPATIVYVNRSFVAEWDQLALLGRMYAAAPGTPATSASRATTSTRKRPGAIAKAKNAWLTTRARLNRQVLSSREPVVRPLRAGNCPDCSATLLRREDGLHCESCRVVFADPDTLLRS